MQPKHKLFSVYEINLLIGIGRLFKVNKEVSCGLVDTRKQKGCTEFRRLLQNGIVNGTVVSHIFEMHFGTLFNSASQFILGRLFPEFACFGDRFQSFS